MILLSVVLHATLFTRHFSEPTLSPLRTFTRHLPRQHGTRMCECLLSGTTTILVCIFIERRGVRLSEVYLGLFTEPSFMTRTFFPLDNVFPISPGCGTIRTAIETQTKHLTGSKFHGVCWTSNWATRSSPKRSLVILVLSSRSVPKQTGLLSTAPLLQKRSRVCDEACRRFS